MDEREQAEQALREAGFTKFKWHTDKVESWQRPRHDGLVDLVRVPFDFAERPIEWCTWVNVPNLLALLEGGLRYEEILALQGAIRTLDTFDDVNADVRSRGAMQGAIRNLLKRNGVDME